MASTVEVPLSENDPFGKFIYTIKLRVHRIGGGGVTRISAITGVVGLLIGATWAMAQTVETESFKSADSVHIIGNDTAGTAKDTRTVWSRKEIEALYRVVSSKTDDWHHPTFDSPSLQWKVEFLRDGMIVGSFGIGRDFLAVGDYLHSLTPEQKRRVEELVNTSGGN